jgi:hypothetical protein
LRGFLSSSTPNIFRTSDLKPESEGAAADPLLASVCEELDVLPFVVWVELSDWEDEFVW